jgi:hypothetical protein
MAHEEFPPLTEQAKHVLRGIINDWIDVSQPCWDRRFAASVIREAVRQAGTFTVGTDFKREAVEVVALNCIADNLHALPPAPPTRLEMEEALFFLLDHLNWHPKSQSAQKGATLAAGIAHYCKEQP